MPFVPWQIGSVCVCMDAANYLKINYFIMYMHAVSYRYAILRQ